MVLVSQAIKSTLNVGLGVFCSHIPSITPKFFDVAAVNIISTLSVSQKRCDSGLSSFFIASALSSIKPDGWSLNPILEGLSWTLFLQSALVLGIWSSSPNAGKSNETTLNRTNKLAKMTTMMVAFFIGVIGSLIGSLVGVPLASSLSSASQIEQSLVWPIAASCLAASYIGGTANFYETASALGAKGTVAKTLNLIAGIDILVMVVYFGVLLGVRGLTNSIHSTPNAHNHPLLNIFPGLAAPSSSATTSAASAAPSDAMPISDIYQPPSLRTMLTATALASSVAFIATRIQTRFRHIPGLSVVLSVLSALLLNRSGQLRRLLDSAVSRPSLRRANEYMMAAFYACIGSACRLQDVFTVGLPVLGLMVSLLVTHLTIMLWGCGTWNWLIKRARPTDESYLINVDTAVIASNACVGGASTATAMAASFTSADSDLPFLGSVAGLIGYVIGTPLGLLVARMLRASPL